MARKKQVALGPGMALVRFGTFLLLLGGLSAVLPEMGWQLRILAWASDFQPWLGLGVGFVGALLIVTGIVVRNRAVEAENARQAAQPYGQAQPYGHPGQPYGVAQPGQYFGHSDKSGQPGQYGGQYPGQPG